MANEYNISAGLVPIDNSTGATANSFYISAGLVPTDTGAAAMLLLVIDDMNENLGAMTE